jgi:SAM-dependent methyltransferase
MKIRDSGMPEESHWETLLDIPLILSSLDIGRSHDVAELGCGYGSFTIPVADAIKGTLHTFDIDPAMVERTKARAVGRTNIVYEVRDVIDQGFGVRADAVLLFNILHCEQPVELLRHAAHALKSNGRVLAIHWRYGETPRGPILDIRPKPEQLIAWGAQAGLRRSSDFIDLPPWHYGLVLEPCEPGPRR